jgi:hypothetical protein
MGIFLIIIQAQSLPFQAQFILGRIRSLDRGFLVRCKNYRLRPDKRIFIRRRTGLASMVYRGTASVITVSLSPRHPTSHGYSEEYSSFAVASIVPLEGKTITIENVAYHLPPPSERPGMAVFLLALARLHNMVDDLNIQPEAKHYSRIRLERVAQDMLAGPEEDAAYTYGHWPEL